MCSSPPKVELVQRWRGVNSLNGAPCSHHPALGAKGSAISYHEDMPSPELADRALVDAGAVASSAYESTFSRAGPLLHDFQGLLHMLQAMPVNIKLWPR